MKAATGFLAGAVNHRHAAPSDLSENIVFPELFIHIPAGNQSAGEVRMGWPSGPVRRNWNSC